MGKYAVFMLQSDYLKGFLNKKGISIYLTAYTK